MFEHGMVLLPVPLRLVDQVAAYVEDLRAGRPAGLAPEQVAAVTVSVPGQGDWSQSMVAELADRVPYEGVLALLDRCAQTSGTWVVKSEVEDALGISAIQLRNELGALSKLTKRMFGGEPTWPVEWKKEKGKFYYRMDDQVAQWWAAVRRDARGGAA